MKDHSHPARPWRPTSTPSFFIFASALLVLAFCVSASAQDDRYRLASAVDGPSQVAASGDSSEAVISADGRFVAFTSLGSNLVAVPTLAQNVYVRDLQAGTTRLVSINKDGTGGGDNFSSFPSVSADGRFVAFHSYANNLPNHLPAGIGWGIYVRDLSAGVTTPAAVPDVPNHLSFFRVMMPAAMRNTLWARKTGIPAAAVKASPTWLNVSCGKMSKTIVRSRVSDLSSSAGE